MRREEVAEGTMAFHFEKPSGFTFKAGQSADVTLTNPPETDTEGNTRTRMRDTAFQALAEESATSYGSQNRISRRLLHPAQESGQASRVPRGRNRHHAFSQHRAAGRSRPTSAQLHLFYSNRRPEDAAFLDTLQTLETTNPHFHLICTMTEMAKSKKEWKGEIALIDKEVLSRDLTTLQGPIYYVAGRASPHGGDYATNTCECRGRRGRYSSRRVSRLLRYRDGGLPRHTLPRRRA
jgi:flavin-dependent oxidoreductase